MQTLTPSPLTTISSIFPSAILCNLAKMQRYEIETVIYCHEFFNIYSTSTVPLFSIRILFGIHLEFWQLLMISQWMAGQLFWIWHTIWILDLAVKELRQPNVGVVRIILP